MNPEPIDYVALVRKHPGLTATELSKHTDREPASLGAGLFEKVQQFRINKVHAIGAKGGHNTAWRYVPINGLKVGRHPEDGVASAPSNYRFTLGFEFPITAKPLEKIPATVGELFAALIPHLTKEQTGEIIAAAAQHRFEP